MIRIVPCIQKCFVVSCRLQKIVYLVTKRVVSIICCVLHPQRLICVVHIFVFFVSFGCYIVALVFACGPEVGEISSLATLYYFYVHQVPIV